MRFTKLLSKEIVAIVSVGLAIGMLVGVGFSSVLFIPQAVEMNKKLLQKGERIALLESLVVDRPDFSGLDDDPPPPMKAAPAEAGGSRGADVAPSRPAPAPIPPSRASKPISAPAPQRPKASERAPQKAQAPVMPVRPVTSQEIEAALSGSKIEGVSASKAKVAKVTKDGVYLSSGRLIRPGEQFSSGERLLQVDPENNRVVTSERQLLLFFGG